MTTKVIACAICQMNTDENSPQIGNISDQKKMDIYFKNAFVSLKSAALKNPDAAVCLVVNVPLSKAWSDIFSEHGIQVYLYGDRYFKFPKDYPWAAAYFKLDALLYLSERYHAVVVLDADTFTVGSYEDLWRELRHSVLLFDINHKISHPHRQDIIQNYENLYGTRGEVINHRGGEFLAGEGELLKEFIAACQRVYKQMEGNLERLERDMGDEQIISIAAHFMRGSILSANKYIFRFWTSPKFHLTSSVYKQNKVDIWHLPNAKDRGMVYLYDYYQKHQEFPSTEKCADIFEIDRLQSKFIKFLFYKVKTKIKRSGLFVRNKLTHVFSSRG